MMYSCICYSCRSGIISRSLLGESWCFQCLESRSGVRYASWEHFCDVWSRLWLVRHRSIRRTQLMTRGEKLTRTSTARNRSVKVKKLRRSVNAEREAQDCTLEERRVARHRPHAPDTGKLVRKSQTRNETARALKHWSSLEVNGLLHSHGVWRLCRFGEICRPEVVWNGWKN